MTMHSHRRRTRRVVASIAVLALAVGGFGVAFEIHRGDRRGAADANSAVDRVGQPPIDWNRYYSNDETNAIMRGYAQRHPNVTRIESIGKSYLGVDLMSIEITNRATGAAEDKPALYVDGNIHAGELTGGAVALYLVGYLLDRYGSDEQVTRLVDTRTFYIRPKFNPDGADLALLEDQSLRSSVRPVDNDGDGVPDDDPNEDLNGDGFITQMRIVDPDGNMKAHPEDARLMARRTAGDAEGPFYRVLGAEGIDNDGDGRQGEDGIGGLDMNRNFPRNWELEYIQGGAGAFPLSEPETYATVKFIDAHPNIAGIVHGHTSGGFVYRLPSASDPTKFPAEDLKLILDLGAYYTETTGRRVQPSSTDPTRHRYGTLISWGYWDRGIIGWVPEFWPGLPERDELARLRRDDAEWGGKYFVEWTPFDHPEHGRIEIGGWRNKFIGQNPPAELLEAECSAQIPWILSLIEKSPLLEVTEPRVTALEAAGGARRYRIEVTATNVGYQPTNLTERGIDARVVAPVLATIDVIGGKLVEGNKRTRMGHLAGSYPVPEPDRPKSATATWTVELDSPQSAIQVSVISEKGGTKRFDPIRPGARP